MHVLFLNQYFPPDPAPTGLLLREIADRLIQAGHTVEFVSSQQSYRAGKPAQPSRSRAVREAKALVKILLRAVRARKPDVIFSATSPPLLLLLATMLARWHRAKSAHWLFDMYPELALALDEIPLGLFSRAVQRLMHWAYRQTDVVVTLDGDMQARLRHYHVASEIIPPWILHRLPENPPALERSAIWLYSGNLGRAHEWETLLEAQAILEKRALPWRLVFQGGGPMREPAQARASAMGLRQCDWKGYVAENALAESLLAADVLVVTQRPETSGLLWPSKLALVRALPRRILWVGPRDSAIGRELAALPQAGVFAPGEATQIADWLAGGNASSFVTTDAPAIREAGVEKWTGLLTKLAN